MTARRRGLVLVLSAGVLAALVWAGLHAWGGNGSSTGTTADAANTPAAVRTDPGTPAGANHLEPGPGDPVATDPDPATATGDDGGRTVLTYADFVPGSGLEVGGFVPGLVEDGGTCRAVATLGGTVASTEVDGVADASTTSCGGLLVPADDLAAGTWKVVLEYESDGVVRTSDPVSVEVSS